MEIFNTKLNSIQMRSLRVRMNSGDIDIVDIHFSNNIDVIHVRFDVARRNQEMNPFDLPSMMQPR